MSFSRRALLSAIALAAPAPAFAQWPFGLGRRGRQPPREGRADYAGPPLRQQLGDWQFEIAKAAASTRLQPVIRDVYEVRLNEAIGKMPGVRAVTAAVAEPDGSVWTQAWRADPGPLPTRFHWASVGKAYTATAIMQMVEGGQLSLTDTLDRWAPAMPNAPWITLEDLLAHTSGLYSFQADETLRATPGYKTPEQLLAVAAGHPPLFPPGANWAYSNTNYVLLGQIIEAVDGKPWHEALAQRIAARRDLDDTIFIAPQGRVAGLAPPAPSETAPGTADDISTPYAAGAVAASALDMVRFWRDLLADRLTGPEATRRRFYRLYPMSGVGTGHYGLGVMVSDLSAVDPSAEDVWLGHSGGLPGAKAVVAYSMQTRAFVAVALTGEGSPEATANLLLTDLRR
ncbi:MAG: beta-lactamase family protein [Alphaproteobacteria bacterium]|nr:beta-lactamase family protein [Alphaproteobacteria bacterium]